MQERETHTASEPELGTRIYEARARQMDEVLSRCLPSFHRRAYRYVGNAADAEDVVQDALIAAFRHLDRFRGQAQMSTWLTTIVTNCARMQLRRRPRQTALSLDEHFGEDEQYCLSNVLADPTPSPEAECGFSELRKHLMQFVAELSPSLRKAFELRDLEELTTSEAAHILGVPEGTVKAQVSRARTKLKKRLMHRSLDPQLNVRRTYTAPLSVAKK
jgi:RNA polymerase sigma-70 factor, ECF subfamily